MSSTLESAMRETTETFVANWNGDWTVRAAIALRAPDCVHTVLPASLSVPVRSNEQFATYFERIEGFVTDAKMALDDYVSSPASHRIVARTSLTATTPVGPYTNEYVWFLTFDETGKSITRITEFMDSIVVEDLLSRLAKAGMLGGSVGMGAHE